MRPGIAQLFIRSFRTACPLVPPALAPRGISVISRNASSTLTLRGERHGSAIMRTIMNATVMLRTSSTASLYGDLRLRRVCWKVTLTFHRDEVNGYARLAHLMKITLVFFSRPFGLRFLGILIAGFSGDFKGRAYATE